MDSFVFAFNAVSPIIAIVAIGYLLKRMKIVDLSFAKLANRLVFHLFLPAMLFLNVYKIESIGNINPNYIFYTLVVILGIFIISIPLVIVVTKHRDRRGALLQAAFRSNYALIGIPLSKSLFGDEGVMVATLLSAVVVPTLNILAVISLSIFRDDGHKPSVKKILINIVKNPLIQSVAAGLVILLIRVVFEKNGITFRLGNVSALMTFLNYLSNLATPLALIALGAQFEFSAVSSLKREIIYGTLVRTVAVPVLGIGIAYLFFSEWFTGAHFAAFVAAFGTPVAISSVPMTQEMKSDVTLAGQLVVWTTIVSGFTIFFTAFLLKCASVF